MDESECLQDLRDLIAEQQYGELKAAMLEANVSEIEKVWLEIADKTRRSPQKYKKLMDVLKGCEAMSRVVTMLETKFGACADCGKIVSIKFDGSPHAHKRRVFLEKKGDIEEAEEEIAELPILKGELKFTVEVGVLLEKKGDIEEAEEKIAEQSIIKGELKFTVKGGDYGHRVSYPESELMNPELVHALAAGDLKGIADVLFSLDLIDGKVYEGLKQQTKTMHQRARDFKMNAMKELSKFLDDLRKQKEIEHLVVIMKTRCSAKKVGGQIEGHPPELSAGIKKGTCPLCGKILTRNKDGSLHKHKCIEEEFAKLSIGEDVQEKKFEEKRSDIEEAERKKQGKKPTDTCPYCGKTVSINYDGSLHGHKRRVLLEKKGDIEEAEEKIAEEVSILKGKLKFTVKGGDYGHRVSYPERELMNPKLVHALAAGDLKDIADVLFSLHLIDGEVYEELKLQTKTMHQIARDFDMNRMKDFSKLLDVLRKQKGIEHLVVFMKTRCPVQQARTQGYEKVTIGKITYNSKALLDHGCYGGDVYKGKFENKDVAVKIIFPESPAFVDSNVELLITSDSHPCIIRCYCMEEQDGYRYLALELAADCTLYDYVKGRSTLNYSERDAIKLLMQAIEGLRYLHKIGIVHCDIEPHNILLCSLEFKAKLFGYGFCKKLPLGSSSSVLSNFFGTDWIAPEGLPIESGELSHYSDIFSMGCVIYFVLTSGQHPFGSDSQDNIRNDKRDLSELCKIKNYTALDLVQTMISHDSHDRPTAEEVLCHCLFWSEEKQLKFFVKVSDYIYKDRTSPVFKALEENASIVFEGNWKDPITSDLKSVLEKEESYDGSLVSDLIHFIRNKSVYYEELSEELKKCVGRIPDVYVRYFTSRFPALLVHTYKAFVPMEITPTIISEENPFDTLSFDYKGGTEIWSWKDHGFEMEFQCDSLLPGVMKSSIKVSVSLMDDFMLPENTMPVSAFFTINCEHQLIKNVLLKIEHCAINESFLTFAISSSTSPYNFELVKDGKFIGRYGKIQRSNFSTFVILLQGWKSLVDIPTLYIALYSRTQNEKTWKIYLFVTLFTEFHKLNLRNYASEHGLTIKDYSEATIKALRRDASTEVPLAALEMDYSVSQENKKKGFCVLDDVRTNIRITPEGIAKKKFFSEYFFLKTEKTETTTFNQVYSIRGVRLNIDGLHLLLRSNDVEWLLIRRIIRYHEVLSGYGSHGNNVFKGKFGSMHVAVKKVKKKPPNSPSADAEVDLLLKIGSHSCIIGYYYMEEEAGYRYIAFELADCTLSDYVKSKFKYSEAIKFLMQAMEGLHYLHLNKFVHGGIRRFDIMIFFKSGQAKLSGFGLSKKLTPESNYSSAHSGEAGTSGRTEVKLGQKLKSKDIYSMGCVIYFTLTSGQLIDNHDLAKLSKIKNITAKDLVQKMICEDPCKRPTAEEVLRHCLFWIEKKQLEFFKEVHFYTKQKHHDAYKAIEEGASILFKDSWKNYITSCHLTNKKECRISVYLVYVFEVYNYTEFSRVGCLIRLIRNVEAHYNDYDGLIKKANCTKDEFVHYFTSRFPSLLVYTYNVMKNVKGVPTLNNYY